MITKLQSVKEEREQGFTLIELLVVILIIGILSAIAIPAFMNQRKSAVDSSVQSDVSNAAKQVETWIVKQGSTEEAIPSIVTSTSSWNTAAGIAGTPLADIKVSDGTVIHITGTSAAYTIHGHNPGGDAANDSTPTNTADAGGVKYSSTAGGLQK